MQTEPNKQTQPYFKRFIDVSVEKFLRTEMQLLTEKLPTETQPRRSSEKGPTKSALLFRGFVDGILAVTEHLINSMELGVSAYSISKQIYDFFHLEDKMRPLMRLNEPVSLIHSFGEI